MGMACMEEGARRSSGHRRRSFIDTLSVRHALALRRKLRQYGNLLSTLR